MKKSEKVIELLRKKAIGSISVEEAAFLQESFSLEEIEQYSKIIQTVDLEEYNVELSSNVKSLLLSQFSEFHKVPSRKKSVVRPLFIKLSAVAILLVALGISLFFFLPKNKKTAFIDKTNSMESMDFVEVGEEFEVKEVETEKLTEETKYLMHVDFFSNSGFMVK